MGPYIGEGYKTRKYLCFFRHGEPTPGVVTEEEWAKNPDTGIEKLREEYRREHIKFVSSVCPQRGIRYRDTNKWGKPKGKPGRKPKAKIQDTKAKQ